MDQLLKEGWLDMTGVPCNIDFYDYDEDEDEE